MHACVHVCVFIRASICELRTYEWVCGLHMNTCMCGLHMHIHTQVYVHVFGLFKAWMHLLLHDLLQVVLVDDKEMRLQYLTQENEDLKQQLKLFQVETRMYLFFLLQYTYV